MGMQNFIAAADDKTGNFKDSYVIAGYLIRERANSG